MPVKICPKCGYENHVRQYNCTKCNERFVPKQKKSNRGIQAGQCATSEQSKTNETAVRKFCYDIVSQYKIYPELTYRQSICKTCGYEKTKIFGRCNHRGYVEPDGGIWYYNKKIILVIESKHQDDSGNALERIGSNLHLFEKHPDISSNFIHITYLTGAVLNSNATLYSQLNKLYFNSGINAYSQHIINNSNLLNLVNKNKYPYLWFGHTIVEDISFNLFKEAIVNHLNSFTKNNYEN